MKSLFLAGGCFWCLDSTYMQFKGVQDVVVGYMGGTTENPTYEDVCTGETGHAEVVEVIFDENIIPINVILDMFFTLHDPTQLNRQGEDIGTQYRSAMFYKSETELQQFKDAIARAKEIWDGQIVTELAPASTFWMGESYHQDFFAKNPNQGYCNAVVAPKMAKTRKAFMAFMRD